MKRVPTAKTLAVELNLELLVWMLRWLRDQHGVEGVTLTQVELADIAGMSQAGVYHDERRAVTKLRRTWNERKAID